MIDCTVLTEKERKKVVTKVLSEDTVGAAINRTYTKTDHGGQYNKQETRQVCLI